MPTVLSRTTVDAVFSAAVAATHWRSSNLGKRVTIWLDGYDYVVEIHESGRYLARIDSRSAWGNCEWIEGANATQVQHRQLRAAADAAIAARRTTAA